jgi:hypothetical protein
MSKYTFICNAYKDYSQFALNLPSLRKVYPDERVVIITDGDPALQYEDLAACYRCELIRGERLYRLECGSLITQRMIDIYLAGSGEYLVKFDTDTRFFRPLTIEPSGAASGCIWGSYGFRYLQGGCRLFSRSCAEQIDRSGILKGNRYKDLTSWCPPTAEEEYKDLGQVSDDFIVRDALLELGIEIIDHPEIFSAGYIKRWRLMDVQTLTRVLNSDKRYAITHPWKLVDVKWALALKPLLSNAFDSDNTWHNTIAALPF